MHWLTLVQMTCHYRAMHSMKICGATNVLGMGT